MTGESGRHAPAATGRRAVWGWALYDWANSAYATTVMAGFFPLFFKSYWGAGTPATESTLHLGLVNSASSVVIVLLAPLLGVLADHGGTRKGFLALFTLVGASTTSALYWVGQGEWFAAALLYLVATIGFGGALVFYDALLLSVAVESRWDAVSAFGFALGYLGGGLLFAVNVAMTLWPGAFALSGVSEAVRLSFVTVGGWWLFFSLPLFLWVREQPATHGRTPGLISGFRQLRRTFREIRQLPELFLFLAAYWCYIDGVDTIVRMAVDYGMAIGLPSQSLIIALLMTQFIGFPAALGFGRLASRLGPKAGIFIALCVYTGVVLWAARMESAREFYLLAAAIGLVQGGIQSLSRSLYARLVPAPRSAEFFGFFNIMGKFAAVLGPAMVGWTSALTGNPRLSLLSLLLLFAVGGLLLWRVDVASGRRSAQAL